MLPAIGLPNSIMVGERGDLWNHIDLGLKFNLSLLPKLCEQMTELLWNFVFNLQNKGIYYFIRMRSKWNDVVVVIHLFFLVWPASLQWTIHSYSHSMWFDNRNGHMTEEPEYSIPFGHSDWVGSDMSVWLKFSQLKYSLRICWNHLQRNIVFSWGHFERTVEEK